MLLHLVRRWSRALKAVTLLVPPLMLASCGNLLGYSAAGTEFKLYMMHSKWAGQALAKDDCATAEREMREALKIAKHIKEIIPNEVGADVTLGQAYKGLGYVYAADTCARPAEAVGAYRQALRIFEEAKGADHHYVADTLNNLGRAYYMMGRYEQAEPLLVRALEIWPASSDALLHGPVPQLNLAEVYQAEGRYADAEAMFERSLDAIQRAHLLGNTSGTVVAHHLRGYAGFLRQTGRLDEAGKLEARARTIESEDEPGDRAGEDKS